MSLVPAKRRLFQERLKLACESKYGALHGSASKVGREIGLAPQTIAKWLRGDTFPSEERWGPLAAVLGVDVHWLFGETHAAPAGIPSGRSDAEVIGKAAELVFPLVKNLRPDAQESEVAALTVLAYEMLKDGSSTNETYGVIAKKLVDMNG